MTGKRDRPGVIAPPPLIVAGFVAVGWALQKGVPINWALPYGVAAGAKPLLVGGALLCIWSLVDFARWKTNPDPFHPTSRIISTGPFRWTRNPIYLGFLLLHLGFALQQANVWMTLAIVPSALVLHRGVVLREERYLEQKFGEVYIEYKTKVRRWL